MDIVITTSKHDHRNFFVEKVERMAKLKELDDNTAASSLIMFQAEHGYISPKSEDVNTLQRMMTQDITTPSFGSPRAKKRIYESQRPESTQFQLN